MRYCGWDEDQGCTDCEESVCFESAVPHFVAVQALASLVADAAAAVSESNFIARLWNHDV